MSDKTSPTPLTDAARFDARHYNEYEVPDGHEQWVVPAEFAQRLETAVRLARETLELESPVVGCLRATRILHAALEPKL